MIEHVYRRAESSKSISKVIVATDDLRIATTVTGFGGNVRLTRAGQKLYERVSEKMAAVEAEVGLLRSGGRCATGHASAARVSRRCCG